MKLRKWKGGITDVNNGKKLPRVTLSGKEVVEYLLNEGEDFFQQTRAFNKCLMDQHIIKKRRWCLSSYAPI